MLHPELKALIASGDVKIGDKVWICDYRYDNPTNQPIRNVEPQEVFIMSGADTKKKIYYSDFYFAPISTKGAPLAKVIAPFDNTGFRGYTGISVNIFLEEKDCRKKFAEQCDKATEQLNKALSDFTAQMNKRINETDELKVLHGRV